MSMFDMFRKKKSPVSQPQTEEIEDLEEYVVTEYVPLKFSMTGDLLRRQREEEIRNKYCNHSVGVESTI